MLRSIKQLYGDKLGASDGDIGHVKDFYFDDQHWAVRYVIADTGTWLPGRLVIISPHAFGGLPETGKVLPVKLTRKQIEKSPTIESHKPVSRQHEEEYYRYHGLPFYWQGAALWGATEFPVISEGPNPVASEVVMSGGDKPKMADVHLRSAQAVTGYQIQAGDEIVGHVTDYMMDSKSWVIGDFVINTGNRFTGSKVLLAPGQIDRISWEESKIYVKMTKETFFRLPPYDVGHANLASIAQ